MLARFQQAVSTILLKFQTQFSLLKTFPNRKNIFFPDYLKNNSYWLFGKKILQMNLNLGCKLQKRQAGTRGQILSPWLEGIVEMAWGCCTVPPGSTCRRTGTTTLKVTESTISPRQGLKIWPLADRGKVFAYESRRKTRQIRNDDIYLPFCVLCKMLWRDLWNRLSGFLKAKTAKISGHAKNRFFNEQKQKAGLVGGYTRWGFLRRKTGRKMRRKKRIRRRIRRKEKRRRRRRREEPWSWEPSGFTAGERIRCGNSAFRTISRSGR